MSKAGMLEHPDNILEEIFSDDSLVPSRFEKLDKVHELCRSMLESGERDFSAATVGRLVSDKGIMNGRVFFNQGYESFRKLLDAWQAFADFKWLGKNDALPLQHPNIVLVELLKKDVRGDRKSNLRAFHELCQRHHATGSLDFTPKTIGRLCNEQGVMNGHNLVSKGFEDFRVLLKAWDDYARPWLAVTEQVGKPDKEIRRSHDTSLEWVRRDYPEFSEWRGLAAEWLCGTKSGLSQRISALAVFFKNYLTRPDVPTVLLKFFERGEPLPDFQSTACSNSTASVDYCNQIATFLDWVLLRDFSDIADDGERVVSPAFRNPVKKISKSSDSSPDESVRNTLPYGFIHELRTIVAEGPSFRDWKFAQSALGVAEGEVGAPGRDWFEVPKSAIDESDPDCVWRIRTYRKKQVYQMWSPVRWVALHIKLLLPLRTFQVRMLDSGESDTWNFCNNEWVQNTHTLVKLNGKAQWKQGVFRRITSHNEHLKASTLLYINTNKTADRKKSGPNKGYLVPWYVAANQSENVFYWLEKLRNWQSRFNPITVRTKWAELDGRHIGAKTAAQLASYPDTCFLFRMAELEGINRRLPVSDGVVTAAWNNLLEELEQRLAARKETHPGGARIQLVTRDAAGRLSTEFPLHSLRVSLITALALDGEVPFPILQKLVGHSRLIMTLYYTKPGHARTTAMLHEAAQRLDSKKEKSIHDFLLNTEHAKLVESAVCNSTGSLASIIPTATSARNAAGWMLMHHGLCLVGGNTSELEDNKKIGGCYNGGPDVGAPGKPSFGPVSGGSRNCIRCRWFVTEPHHLPALAAHFNAVAYHFDEARNKSIEDEKKLQSLKRLRAQADSVGEPFLFYKELRQTERIWEASMKVFSDLAEDLVACWRLIERCKILLSGSSEGGLQVVLPGSSLDVCAVFEETESELLQLSGVCAILEIYPDLNAGKAVIRRSQLLDSALYNEGLPPIFMRLTEEEQLAAGNALMKRLAMVASPQDRYLGERKVIEIIDAGKKLSDYLGVDLKEHLPHDLTEPSFKIDKAVRP
jgi:hypothetical protein